MLYKKIKYSFFNFQNWYKFIYDRLEDGDSFVEIGTWTGASAVYFGELIKLGSKNIHFTTIDTFKGSKEHQDHPLIVSGQLLSYFLENMKPLKNYMNVIVGDSKVRHNEFSDNSLSAIFFDGDHSLSGFEKDLTLWYPKVKNGGIVSGHDYIWGGKGVKPVVDVFANKPVNHIKKCGVWWYEK